MLQIEHGNDWGWLVYGMVAFAACLHCGQLTNADWMVDLQSGTFARADALVVALGTLPHVAQGFRELPNWAAHGSRWNAAPGDKQLEGSFMCAE